MILLRRSSVATSALTIVKFCFSFNFGPTWPEVNFVKSAYSVRHSLLNVVKYYNQLLFRLRGAT